MKLAREIATQQLSKARKGWEGEIDTKATEDKSSLQHENENAVLWSRWPTGQHSSTQV